MRFEQLPVLFLPLAAVVKVDAGAVREEPIEPSCICLAAWLPLRTGRLSR